jgi:hypothetical protein
MSTLKLKIGESQVDTIGLEIPVVLRSSLFQNKGSYLFNFSLPATELLRKEFSHIHRPSRSGPAYIEKKLELTFGLLKFNGTATISQASAESYEISCPIDSGDLASVFKSKKLTDIDMGGLRTVNSQPLRARATMSADVYFDMFDIDPFTESVTFALDSISINPVGELSLDGLHYTSSENTAISFMFTVNTNNYVTGSATLRIFKNNIQQGFAYLSGFDHASFEIPMLTGDVVTWDILFESAQDFDGSHRINFQINQATALQVLLPYDAMSQHGTAFYPYSDYASFPVQNPKFFDAIEDDTYQVDNISFKETFTKFFPVVNYYINNAFPVAMSGFSEGQVFSTYNIFTPFPYLAYFINRLALDLNITINNNVFQNLDLNQLVIFNAYSENNLITNELIVPTFGYDLADHLPNILVSEYWLNLCALLGIGWEYNSSTRMLQLANLNDIAGDTNFIDFPSPVSPIVNLQASNYNGFRLKQEASDDSFINDNFRSLDGLNYLGSVAFIGSLPFDGSQQVNDCYFVRQRKAFFIWNYDKDNGVMNWIFHSYDFFFTYESIDPTLGDNTLEIKTKIFPIMLKGYAQQDEILGAPPLRGWIIPETHQPGTFDGLPDYFKSDFTTSLLFYRGLQRDHHDNLYPLGTNDVFNYDGERIDLEEHTATLSLRWDGEYGLYEKRYKKWIDFLLRSPGTWEFYATMTPHEVSKISFLKWYTIQGSRFLIKEMNFNIYNDHISEVKILAVAK